MADLFFQTFLNQGFYDIFTPGLTFQEPANEKGKDSDMELSNLDQKRDSKKEEEIITNRFFHKFELMNKFMNWMLILMIPFSLVTLYLALTFGINSFVSKIDIKSQIITAIGNDCDLRVIKNIFENRKIIIKGLTKIFSKMDYHYTRDVPLSKVLEDIRSDVFTTSPDNKPILNDLDKIIYEHNERNPFDALEPSQKDYFENIRFKAAANYKDIRKDVDKLATELEMKNSLVTKYLNRSTTNYWISIIALIFALTIGLYQLFQNRSSRLKQFISSALAESSSEKSKAGDVVFRG